MVNLLISVLLSGLAVTFTIEFISLITLGFFVKERIYAFLTLPLSFGALYCVTDLTTKFIVLVPATAFVALMLNKYLNTKQVTATRLPRL